MAARFNQKIEPQQAPAFFVRGPSAFARLAFFSVFSLVLMAADSHFQALAGIRKNLQTLVHPLQLLANKPSEFSRDTSEYFSTHNYLLNENRQLKQNALVQNIALQKLQTLALENKHLRELLNTNQALIESSVVAEIMHVGRDLFTKKIVVNRGETHDIEPGEAVVDSTGVIGQVTRVYPLSSEVTLITDKSLAIPIQVERNGLRAIAFGHGRDNTLDLPYLPTNVDIRRGDRLVTSGIDGVYPAGLAVASVSQIEITPDSPFARIICVPTGGVENHRQVLLVSIPHTAIPTSPMTNITPPSKLEASAKLPANSVLQNKQVTNVQTKPSTLPIEPKKAVTTTPQKLQKNQRPFDSVSKPHAPQ